MSCAFKDLGKDKVRYDDTSKEADVRDDSRLLKWIHAELSDCDILITQNGKAFDVKKINARFIAAGLPPVHPYKIIDTLLIAKDVAKFTSNKLEWLSKILTRQPKSQHSEFPGMELWVECLKGNKKAWAVMKKYNIQDVIADEQVYLKLRPYMVGHPNVAAYYSDDKMRCPKCGSTALTVQAKPALTQSGEYRRYQCGGCGGYSRSRYTLNTKAKRQSLLAN